MHSEETKQKMREAKLGKKRSEESKKKTSETLKGRKLPDKTKERMSEAKKGRKHSKETKEKMSQSRKDVPWWNNGERNKKSRECPGEGWERGMLKKQKTTTN